MALLLNMFNEIMKHRPIPCRIIALILLFLPFLASAQRRRDNVQLGFTVSPTLGWMEFKSNDASYRSAGSKIGYSYGIIGDFGFAPNYFLGSGFLLTTISSNVAVNLPQGKEDVGYRIQYIEIPLTLKLKSDPENDFRFYGQFGPDLAVKVSGKHDFTTLPVRNDANLLRFGLLVGAGAEWEVGRSRLLTGVSFNNGFTRAFDNPDSKNQLVTLNLGVFF